MPIYEYECQSCGHDLEKLQRINDQPLTDCPDCGEAELRRLVSAAAFRLKGAGWYETDFKKGGKKNIHDSGSDSDKKAASTDKAANSGSSAAPKPKESTKPAAKQESA
jgi:putative FmdB family regulatory protein